MAYRTFESFSSSFWIYEVKDKWNVVLNKACYPKINIEGLNIYFYMQGILLNFYITHPDIGTIKLVADITQQIYKDVFIAFTFDCLSKEVELFNGMNTDTNNKYNCVSARFDGKRGKHIGYRKGDVFLIKVPGEDIGMIDEDELLVAGELTCKSLDVGRFKLIGIDGVLIANGEELDIPLDKILPIHTMRM